MSLNYDEVLANDSELRDGAKAFECFFLRPRKMSEKEAIIRMRINKGWGGWKLKDELVESIKLEIGDTINTEISVLNRPGLIDDADDTDLFASGQGADWLLENDVGKGSVIDAKVKFVYSKAPVGGRDGREVWKLSLVFVEGYRIIKERMTQEELSEYDDLPSFNALRKLLGN